MPLRRSTVRELRLVGYDGGVATLDLLVSSGTYVRAIADALGGHCVVAAAHRGRPVPARRGRRGADRPRRGRARTPVKIARTPVPARAAAARGRDRHLRRRPPAAIAACSRRRSTRGSPRPSITFDPHPRDRARPPRRADHDARAAARAARGGRRRGGADRRVHPERDAARAGGVRRGVPARDRRRGRRRRRGLPLRARPRAATSSCSSASASTCGRRRRWRASRRRRSARSSRPATWPARRSCSAGRPSSTASSSPASAAAARSATRPRISASTRASSCRAYGIYAGFARGHRAALSIGTNPHYGGTERRIEPYLLDFEGDLYGQRLVVEVWAAPPRRARVRERGGARRADRARRRGDARGRPTGLSPQDSRARGIFPGMGEEAPLTVYQSVRCLECGVGLREAGPRRHADREPRAARTAGTSAGCRSPCRSRAGCSRSLAADRLRHPPAR